MLTFDVAYLGGPFIQKSEHHYLVLIMLL